MSLNFLVSTMNKKDYNLIEKMNLQSDSVIVNQCSYTGSNMIEKVNFKVKWLDTLGKGLSRSRNMAINNSWGDICVIADDDIIYEDNITSTILKEFEKNPEADIITFQVKRVDGIYKNYYTKPRKLNYLTSMKVSSVEIAFRSKTIREKSIKFCEDFGAGSTYSMGEENIFLFDCLKMGLNIFYVPINIGYLNDQGDSSWFKGYNKKFFQDQGAIFTEMSQMFSLPFIFQYAIRKVSLYKDEMSFTDALMNMLMGRRNYLSNK